MSSFIPINFLSSKCSFISPLLITYSSCETTITILLYLFASFNSKDETISLFSESKEFVGSSAKIIFLSVIIPLAMATRCSSPPDKSSGYTSFNSKIPNSLRILSILFSISLVDNLKKFSEIFKLSYTVKSFIRL